MFYRIRNSTSAVVVLSEMYGITAPIRSACDTFYAAGFDAISPNYLSLPRSFGIEEYSSACSHYTSIGIEGARDSARSTIERLRPHYDRLFVVGYSAGATTAWLLSSEENLCDGVAAFYSSQIRNHTDIIPKVPAFLVFPSYEQNFDTPSLAKRLSETKQVTAQIFDGGHGFADHRSPDHHPLSSEQAHNETISFFLSISGKDKRSGS